MGKQSKSQHKTFFPSWLRLYDALPSILGPSNLQALELRYFQKHLNLSYLEIQAAAQFFNNLIPKADAYTPLLPQLRSLNHFESEPDIVVHLKEAGAKRHFVLINFFDFEINGRQILFSHDGRAFEVDVLSPFVFTWAEYLFLKKNRKFAEIMVKAFRRKSPQFAADKFMKNLQQSTLDRKKCALGTK